MTTDVLIAYQKLEKKIKDLERDIDKLSLSLDCIINSMTKTQREKFDDIYKGSTS